MKRPIPICTECGCPLNADNTCPSCDDVAVDAPTLDERAAEAMHDFGEGLTQEQAEIEAETGDPLIINLGAASVAEQDTGPAMRYCKACGQMHYVTAGEFYCPLDRNK